MPPHLFARGLLFAPALVATLALCDFARNAERASRDGPIGVLLLLGAVTVALGGRLAFVATRKPVPSKAVARLRPAPALVLVAGASLLAVALTALAEYLGWIGPNRVALRGCAALLGALVGAFWLWGVWRGRFASTAFRRAGATVASAFLALSSVELGLVLLAGSSGSPLFLTEGGARVTLARHRPPAHSLHRGTRLNSGGYLDDEFVPSSSSVEVVAVLADSFGLGIVPRRENFVQVAETALADGRDVAARRVALHNFGVPAIGLPEYASILETEARPLGPVVAVVCLFPSNDLASTRRERRHRASLSRWLVTDVVLRAATWLRESARGRSTDSFDSAPPSPRAVSPEREPSNSEAPTFSESAYLRIELARLRGLDPAWPGIRRRVDRTITWLERMQRRSAVPVRVILIPDEFQVSDALHEALVAADHEVGSIDRNAVYRQLATRLASAGFRVLDLLPALREAERNGRTYHPRDTHWNAHGNRVAGRALASFLASDPALSAATDFVVTEESD